MSWNPTPEGRPSLAQRFSAGKGGTKGLKVRTDDRALTHTLQRCGNCMVLNAALAAEGRRSSLLKRRTNRASAVSALRPILPIQSFDAAELPPIRGDQRQLMAQCLPGNQQVVSS